MDGRARIRIPLLGFNRSGGIRIATQVANCLAQRWEVEIWVPSYASTPTFKLSPQVSVTPIPINRTGRAALLRYLVYLVRHVAHGVDVCVATYFLTTYPLFAAKLLTSQQVQLVYLVQGNEALSRGELDRAKPALTRMLARRLALLSYRLPFKQIAVSNWVKTQVGGKDAVVIPNGIDLGVFSPGDKNERDASRVTIGAIGRSGPTKGLDILLQSLASFVDDPRTRVHILSDENLPLPEGVHVVSSQSDADIVDFYRRCDIFVFPAVGEGFGLPPLEAMACGAATIVADSGGVREFANKVNAVLVPARDAGALREAILTLANDEAHRLALRQEGFSTAQRYSAQKMCARYLHTFEQILLRNDR